MARFPFGDVVPLQPILKTKGLLHDSL